jgi:hypothetical protein
MLFTSLTAVALTGLTLTNVAQPSWQPDYRTALAQVSRDHKPLAVFIGTGGKGFEQVVSGSLPADAVETLKAKYVCLYVDASTDAGKPIAASFGLTEGVVISDRSGEKQALRHAGRVAPTELQSYLTRFADVATAATTEVRGTATPAPVVPTTVTSYYPDMTFGNLGGGSCPNGRCGVISTCPNGRCGR